MAIFSIESLKLKCDSAFATSGTYGYLTLLTNTLSLQVAYTADQATDRLTAPQPHGLVTGSRVSFFDGIPPLPLAVSATYFAINVSATDIKVAATLSDAIAGIAINLTNNGGGSQTFSELAINSGDPINVLINKEVVGAGWPNRLLVENLGAADNFNGTASKPTKEVLISSSAPVSLTFKYVLVIESATVSNAGIGAVPVPGTGFILHTEAAIQTIGQSQPPLQLSLTLIARNH